MTAHAPAIEPPPVLQAAAPPAAGPLSPEHLQQFDQANLRAKKLRKAAGVAMFNGCTMGFFAGCTLLFAAASPLFGELDVTALVMGLALGAITCNEFRGRQLLRQFELHGPRRLGWNQLALMAILIAYCAWMIGQAVLGPNPYAEAIEREPMLGSMLEPVGRLYTTLSLAVYGGVIVGTVIFQGLNAVYYFTRAKHLRAYLNETPAWVVELQRHSVPA